MPDLPFGAHPSGSHVCDACVIWQATGGRGANPSAEQTTHLRTLLPRVQAMRAMPTAASTAAAYSDGLFRFTSTVARVTGVHPLRVLPGQRGESCHHEDVLFFLAESETFLRTSTIENTMAALRWWHRDNDAPSPTDHPDVMNAMRALKLAQSGTQLGHAKPKVALPPELIVYLADVAHRLSLDATTANRRIMYSRDALYLTLAYTACLRKSEAVAVRREHLWLDESGTPVLHVPWSKTDQAGVGVDIPLPPDTTSGLRLKELMTRHAALLDEAGVPPDGPLLGHWRDPKRTLGTPTGEERAEQPNARPRRPSRALNDRLK